MTLHCGDCIEVMRGIPDNSIDLVLTDPPYFCVKKNDWDRQWQNPVSFLAWLADVVDECARVMKPNGSMYLFASPQMTARVECMIAERLNVLNCIRWDKNGHYTGGIHKRSCKEDLRSFFPAYESIIFAEHYGADNMAKGEAGYVAKCDELRGFVFEPLRAYLAEEMDRAGFDMVKVNQAWREWKGGNGGMSSHWFTTSQWTLPTEENYNWLRALFNADGDAHLRREYEDLRREYEDLRREYEDLRREYEDLRREYEDLRREYEDLRREYEDLRRPFFMSADSQYTDTWAFAVVQSYDGKHPCEKPIRMMEHMIAASSRPGAVVLDPFMGSGSTGVACRNLDREFVGIERDPEYFQIAQNRIKHEAQQMELLA